METFTILRLATERSPNVLTASLAQRLGSWRGYLLGAFIVCAVLDASWCVAGPEARDKSKATLAKRLCDEFSDLLTTALPGQSAPPKRVSYSDDRRFGRETARFLRPTFHFEIEFIRFHHVAFSLGPPTPKRLFTLYVFEFPHRPAFCRLVKRISAKGQLVTKAPHSYELRMIDSALAILVIEGGTPETKNALFNAFHQLGETKKMGRDSASSAMTTATTGKTTARP